MFLLRTSFNKLATILNEKRLNQSKSINTMEYSNEINLQNIETHNYCIAMPTYITNYTISNSPRMPFYGEFIGE
jgi:hypothetical protein